MLEAHYTSGKQPTVSFASTSNGRRTWHKVVPVNGKREARAMAKQFDATPWNF